MNKSAIAWAKLGCLLMATALPCRVPADSAQTYLDCLVDFQRYGDSIWHQASYTNAPANSGYWGDGLSTGNGGIRGSCGVAVAYAVLAVAYPADTNRPARIAKIQQALNYASGTHVSGTNVCVDGLRWGHGWQTSLWAGSMGLACLLVQTDLPPATVQSVQRALADEASYRAAIPPASGYVSDTKAEENGWDSNTPALAAAWLSANPNASAWLAGARNYLANTYTVADLTNDPLASWISTVTLYPDFALENHGFYHPTYQMVAGMSAGHSLLMAHLADPSVAAQLQPFADHNVLQVWTNLNHLVLDSGEFAYPSGLDWELHDFEQNCYVAWLAAHFNDPLARWTDGRLAQLVRYRQLVNGDGTFVGPSGGGFYREAVEAKRTAIAWLHWQNADFPTGPVQPPSPAFEHLPDVGIIASRTPSGFVSVCYGPQTNGAPPRIMAWIEPSAPDLSTNAFLTTPRLPGIIGLGALGKPTAARLLSLTTNAGFQAELQLTNGLNGTTEVYVYSTGESIAIVEVPFPAAGAVSTPAGSFCVGVENDPLTGGTRTLEWGNQSATITNRSGASLSVTNSWVCLASRYGLTAGPAGYFNYQAAASYNRLGAAEDTLQFMPAQPLAPRYAVWFPGQNPTATSSNAARVSWNVSATNAVLTFPGASGSLVQMKATLAPPPPPYSPYLLPVAQVTASSFQSAYPPTNAVDNNLTDFWVSSGTTPGQGPTTNHPEWLEVTFPRLAVVSEFRVQPRTTNGGYGPKDIQLSLGGTLIYQGTMSATAALDVPLPQPVAATNALLLITSSYDPAYPSDPRNVQVVELSFYERALPGTFGDWVLHEFTPTQLADPAMSGPSGDPDHDGIPNLVEFAVGGNPLAADPEQATPVARQASTTNFAIRFRERVNLGDVQRHFESSTNLIDWSEISPTVVNILTNLGEVNLLEAVFPMQPTDAFFRVGFELQPAH